MCEDRNRLCRHTRGLEQSNRRRTRRSFWCERVGGSVNVGTPTCVTHLYWIRWRSDRVFSLGVLREPKHGGNLPLTRITLLPWCSVLLGPRDSVKYLLSSRPLNGLSIGWKALILYLETTLFGNSKLLIKQSPRVASERTDRVRGCQVRYVLSVY